MPRKPPTVRAYAPSAAGFNSAAAVMPRKQHFGGAAEVLHTASIRPRLLCRGNPARAAYYLRRDRPASIRPRLLCRGNENTITAGYRMGKASIRPRLLCRGNSLSREIFWLAPTGFNSAAAVMPRKPQAVSGHRHRHSASIRPRLLCRGNTLRSRPRTWRTRRFNSAAAVMPRKPQAVSGHRHRHSASIRPRLLCRGNTLHTRARSLNMSGLQFGRGCYAAETGRVAL